ncbi:hypothetical protein [Kiloniella litopenaei]|uniref:hypothetical protein n=1 Tax=Kiloniella litopenaei TaxID=1549748 RepID=UPI003BA976BE
MTRFKLLTQLLTVSGFLFLPINNITFANPINPYPEKIKEALVKYNIDESKITSQKTIRDFRNKRRIFGYDTYIWFEDCKGYLQIVQHRFGRVDQIYTIGECKFPGIESF